LHLDHITQGGDPFEMLEARPLDFGHWSAHKLESMSDFVLRHGEAVAIGVAIDAVYSSLALGLPTSDADRILRCLSELGFSLTDPALHDVELLFDGLEEFRQHLGGRLTLTMLPKVGEPVEVQQMNRELMGESITKVRPFAETNPTVQGSSANQVGCRHPYTNKIFSPGVVPRLVEFPAGIRITSTSQGKLAPTTGSYLQ
ncbi:MAG: hypothetical protein GY888_24845, partial [Planctomycetaceae bacterium]|nr:hypothetical protein [Planctomycetaceae bacterium]